MNHEAMPITTRLAALSAAALAFGLSACGPAGPADPGPPPLEGARIGGPFTLTGENGEPVSWSDFDGRYRTVYFGFTFCPDVCPTDMQRAMAGLRAFEEEHPERGARVQPLFVSIDPARDTPAALREFTDAFHPRLIGLTGSEETLREVAEKFAVAYSRGADQPGGGYLMDHMTVTYLFGPDGEPIATLPTDEGPAAVAAELDRWVR